LKTSRILILFAHPALHKSRVNRVMMRTVRALDGVTFHDLYQIYPEFHIDVKHEQRLLGEHDIVVFQYPYLWFNVPALIKEWQDLVLVHGWAYGHQGDALLGKKVLSVITTGGGEDAYRKNTFNRFTVRELLAPLEQMATRCRMEFLPPFVVHGTFRMAEDEIRKHAVDYSRMMEALRDNRVDFGRARGLERINADLDTVIRD